MDKVGVVAMMSDGKKRSLIHYYEEIVHQPAQDWLRLVTTKSVAVRLRGIIDNYAITADVDGFENWESAFRSLLSRNKWLAKLYEDAK